MQNLIILEQNESLATLIIEVAKNRVPKLDRNTLYTASEILSDVWDVFDKREHILIGKILKALAFTNKVQLRCAGKTSQNWQLFQVA